ncbi:vacuolar protein sorting-associated protein 33B-like [Paramacrobiotus metropolitanus]|uniref:vacuolar protein sorting-associated protein 33B-like n=1 Tax=Paramacrobiotus metropolitanus TaxID=2943436 RepID=UPI0024460752|nr:vacuolar protein sorting-associated protein 33B-like [Paramacrobiotus metropolitanus]
MAAQQDAPSVPYPDFSVFKAVAKNQLIHLLESVPEPKDLVLDDDLMRPLDRIVGASVLKQHGVSCIYKLESGHLLQGADNRLYLFRPTVENSGLIAEHIQADQRAHKERFYRLVMVPKRSGICEKILEMAGVYSRVVFDEFPLELLALDDNIISMEYPRFFREFFVDNNFQFLSNVARTLVTFESLFGKCQVVHTFGRCANIIFGIKQKHQEEQQIGDYNRIPSEVSTLIMIDRDVDYVSALLSPLTYEGLLDEHFGISSGTVDFEPAITGQAKSVKWILNDQDEIFRDIRDRHFAAVFARLSAKAKEIQAVYNQKNDLKTVSDMKTFVSKHLKGSSSQHRSLGLHIAACESIMQHKTVVDFERQLRSEHNLVQAVDPKICQQFIEESMMRCYPIVDVVRLLCLYSLTWGGIPSRMFTQWKDQFLQSYGYQHMLTWHNLKRAGLISELSASASVNLSKVGIRKSRFGAVAKNLQLLPSRSGDCDIRNPQDVDYVFNGAYVPLSCRLVEQVLLVDKLPGFAESARNFHYFQHTQEVTNKSENCHGNVMVFFLGGCSYSEVACLRMLSRKLGVNLIIASTAFVSGSKFLTSIVDDL